MSEEINEPAVAEPEVVDVAQDAPQETAPETSDEPQEAPSRREALEKAFETLEDKPEGEKADRERGPDGKFVAKDKPDEPVKAEQPAEAKEADDVPSRFSPDAKAEWQNVPAAVRGEVRRALTELESGLQKKDADLAPLKPYIDMAGKAGQRLDVVLGQYVAMENALRQDPVKGLTAIAQNMGLSLEALVGKVTGQAPDQRSEAKDQEIVQLKQTVQQLQQQVGNVNKTVTQQQESVILKEVQAFAEQNPRFEELSQDIKFFLETGRASDLKGAYELAERLNPGPQPAAPAATPAAPAQTRPRRSVTGAPSSGSSPASGGSSRSEAIKTAFERVGL